MGEETGAEGKGGRSKGLPGTEKEGDTHPAWMAALRTQRWWQGAPSWGLSSSWPAWSPGKGRATSELGGEGQGSGSRLRRAGVAAPRTGPQPPSLYQLCGRIHV